MVKDLSRVYCLPLFGKRVSADSFQVWIFVVADFESTASRGHIPPGLGGHAVQAPGLMRHGPLPAGHRPLDPLPPADLLENKTAARAGEIKRLAGDNHVLATCHVVLRQELIAAQQEVECLQAHIRSIITESDIKTRVLQDKISKNKSNIRASENVKKVRASENVKKELQQAHMEAQSLGKARQELTTKIQEASRELKKCARADVKNLT